MFAIGTRYDGRTITDGGLPVGGATIRVCAQGSTGIPCTPLATVYTDRAMSSPKINPFVSDAQGNFTFYAPGGVEYDLQFSGSGITTFTQANVYIPPIGAGGGGGGGTGGGWVPFMAGGCGGTSPASAYDLPASGGAVPVCFVGTNKLKGGLRFANSGTPVAYITTFIPTWATSLSTDVGLTWQTATSSGTATWQISAACVAINGSSADDPVQQNYWNPSIVTASATANNENSVAGTVSLPAGCTAGMLATFRVKRVDTSGTAVNADLIGWAVQFH
jgi:hypothetical protein